MPVKVQSRDRACTDKTPPRIPFISFAISPIPGIYGGSPPLNRKNILAPDGGIAAGLRLYMKYRYVSLRKVILTLIGKCLLRYKIGSTMQGKRGFDRLLKRYLRDRVAGRDKDTFDAWLDTDKINTEEVFAWKADDERKLFERITGSIDRHARADGWWMTMRLTNPLPIGQWRKMAATVLLILMAS